jgi:N-methylhydantoinase A/oxoprolinase/acetone carboxylase beta subunit
VRLGINIDDTNTNAVLMKDTAILSDIQMATTPENTVGYTALLQSLITKADVKPDQIKAVTIGTSHFTRAIIERQSLTRITVIRLGLPATQAIPPFTGWPTDLLEVISGNAYLAHGGHEFDGRTITRLRRNEIKDIAYRIRDQGIRSIAISSVFSMVNTSMEEEAAEIVRQVIPEASITLSNEIGRIGLLERENAAIINACLCDLANHTIQTIRKALSEMQIAAPLYLSQNDGTAMAACYAERYPVLTFCSVNSNAMRGAAFLSGAREAVVVDMGSKTSEVGVFMEGFPRESVFAGYIGGVRVNLHLPDIFTFNLGTNSQISFDPIRIETECVTQDSAARSLIFGGSNLTAIDIAVAAGINDIGQRSAVANLPPHKVEAVIREMQRMVQQAVNRMRVTTAPVPVVLVGNGSVLLRPHLTGVSDVIRPDYFPLSRAVGAAISQVGGDVEHVFSLTLISRETALQQTLEAACYKASAAGAAPGTIKVVKVQETPLNYLPGNTLYVRVKSMGDLMVSP